MKKTLLLPIIVLLSFASCNPDGLSVEPSNPGSVIGTYKISYIRRAITPTVGQMYNEILNNSDDCFAQSKLIINGNYQFTLTEYQKDNNNVCQEISQDVGIIDVEGSALGIPYGKIEFTNAPEKNTNFSANSQNGVVGSFGFNYTIQNPSPGIARIWTEYFFAKE